MPSPAAQKVITDYLSLPFKNLTGVNAPYFNNKKSEVHGGLRVLVGKGSPADIVEEALIISLRDKLDLSKMTAEEMKKFLVDNHIGIDCSGLAYYVLDAELRARGKGGLKKFLKFPNVKNPLRKLLTKLRTAENTNVKVFANDMNSFVIELKDIQPGDIITMLGSGKNHDRDHMLIVEKVSMNNEQLTIGYVHSLEWRTDGRYNHGVRQGTITVSDSAQPIIKGTWSEQGKTGDENETLERAKFAEKLEIRRLKALS